MDPALELQQALRPPPRSARPIAGFFLDLAIAIGALLILSLACGAVWAAFKGAQIAMQQGGALDPASVVRLLGEPGAIAVIWMTLVSTGGAALLVYYWRRRATREEHAVSRQAVLRIGTWGWVVATATATFVVSSAISFLGQHLGIRPQPTNLAVIEAAYVASPVFMLLFGVLIAPAYEELLFRRVLFGRLWASGRPWLGVLLSSAAFALMHEIPGTTGNSWQATSMLWLTYGFLGAAFAFVYWRTRTLWAAIGAHALNNAIALVLLNLSAGS
ncbi:CPBP family intramembrane glutamic endopeptidase [Pseudoxanthomonas sacheonensis]|uniref:CPBP family intramembrane glutamic endopeptidase n=1 Tax=Pseudoxanthomonas sacheonensis TaxID=443615 RepID=UPI00286A7E1E|nr:CPBP family intramembrane glutamic endopeptidase [Pseudoxanthomonas sacheonensis]